MKIKTITKVVGVFFTLTFFFTSCTTEEVAVEEVESTIINTTASRGGVTGTTEAPENIGIAHIVWENDILNAQKDITRHYYAPLIGTFIVNITGSNSEDWLFDQDMYDFWSYLGYRPGSSDIEEEPDIDTVTFN